MFVFLLKALGMRTSLSQPERAYVHIFILRGKKDICPGLNSHQPLSRSSPQLPSPTPSPGPTLEEASAWAQSRTSSCSRPAGRNAFRSFCRTEFSGGEHALLDGVRGAEERSDKAMIEEKARVIYEDYISILSPKEVGAHQRSRPWAQRTPSVSGRLARLLLLQNKELPALYSS